MKNILIDAGPLIALFDKDDNYHDDAIRYFQKFSGKLVSTWPVLTEVLHMLDFNVRTQISFLMWIQRGGVEIHEASSNHMQRIIELTEKYNNVPMDLADASLIVIAEELGIRDIISIDSDYYIYRTMRKEMLNNIFLSS
jgi:predicted nucleic acid-binding protein